MPRGGARLGAGRKKLTPETVEIQDRGFATRVLERIGKDGWKALARDEVKSAEDYAMYLLTCGDVRIQSENFNKLLDRRYGKPAQGVFVGDTRETVRDLDFGDLPMPAGAKPGTAGKPN